MVACNLPKQTGKKPEERMRKRNCKLPKNKAGWKDRVPVTASPDDNDSGYIIVFVRDTSATTCYGCGGKVRTKPSDNPPPTPFHIFLKDMNCGYFKKEVTYKSLEFPRTRKLNITIVMQIDQPKSMGREMPQAQQSLTTFAHSYSDRVTCLIFERIPQNVLLSKYSLL